MRKIYSIAFLFLVCIGGWKLGEHMSTGSLNLALGVIFGLMVSIPAALISMASPRTVRHVHDHRHTMDVPQRRVEAPQRRVEAQQRRVEAQQQRVEAPKALTVNPTRYTVVFEDKGLQAPALPRLGVKK